jgi:hypothetical protein
MVTRRKNAYPVGGGTVNVAEIEATATDHECAYCGEAILHTDEVLLLTVVMANLVNGQIETYPAMSDDDEFAYEPQYMHFRCAEEALESLDELIENTPPIEDDKRILHCLHINGGGCGSGIRPFEHFALLQLGELHYSSRRPNGNTTTSFVPSGAPNALCLSCLCHINDSVVTMWEDQEDPSLNTVEMFGECNECVHKRCWKHPVECLCECHK